VVFPAERPELGDVYVKTGVLKGHGVFIVKVSPWFAINVERGDPQEASLACSTAGPATPSRSSTKSITSPISAPLRPGAAARMLAASAYAPPRCLARVQAYWQPLALHRERPFRLAADLGITRRRQAAQDRLTSRLPGR
jgi:ornithine cyclodeaminase